MMLLHTLLLEGLEVHFGNDLFKRELAQTQDRETFEGMKVYKYKFQVGEDVLETYVDQTLGVLAVSKGYWMAKK